jgi:hypothetical protein
VFVHGEPFHPSIIFARKAPGLIRDHSTRLGTNNLACYENDTTKILITTLLKMTSLIKAILITLNLGDITYDDITYK